MPITLSLTFTLDRPERLSRSEAREWLARAAVWFEALGDVVLDAHVVLDSEDKPVLLVSLHPTPPPVEIRLGASGKVRVEAITHAAGPGYHAYLCDLLRQMAEEFEMEAEPPEARNDPGGYFSTRQREPLEQHFLRWLGGACAGIASKVTGWPVQLGLSMAHKFQAPGEVLTPLGPRDRQWVEQVAADAQRGREFFPWWVPSPDAAFYRNRALVRMWCEFPWRPPLTEAEGELADGIAADLATAFKLDPSAEMPWPEWLELLAAIEGDREGFTVTPDDRVLSIELWKRTDPVPPKPGVPPIGYRRHAVRERLCSGWSIEAPGDFAREWEDARTWTGWNGSRTVWFQELGFAKPDGTTPGAQEALMVGRRSLPEGERLTDWTKGSVLGEAVFGPHADDDGRTVWRLSGLAAVPGRLVLCNIYVEDATDRDWAVNTWRSLRHEPE